MSVMLTDGDSVRVRLVGKTDSNELRSDRAILHLPFQPETVPDRQLLRRYQREQELHIVPGGYDD